MFFGVWDLESEGAWAGGVEQAANVDFLAAEKLKIGLQKCRIWGGLHRIDQFKMIKILELITSNH